MGGKNIRTRTSAIINDTIKLDFGPDTYMQALRDNIDLSTTRHVLFTHTHSDHLNPHELEMFQPPFAWNHPPQLHIYGHDNVLKTISRAFPAPDAALYQYHLVQPLRAFTIDDTTVTGLYANHDKLETCLIYLFEHHGVRVLWAHDTGYFPPDTWEWLAADSKTNGPLSAVILDCTTGPIPCIDNHLGIDGLLQVKSELRRRAITTDATVFAATHFSHNGKWLHDELEARLNPEGVQVAYDGWTLNV